MSKFKVGDIVGGITSEDEIYCFTTKDAVMKVVGIVSRSEWESREDMEVEIISHANYPEQRGEIYSVSSGFFKLRKPVSLENK